MMKCLICLESPPPSKRRSAIKCGHIFCEDCLQHYCRTREARQSIPCPKCRRPFSNNQTDVFTLLPDYEEAYEIAAEADYKALTEEEKEEALVLSGEAAELGIESSAADLEATVSRAERALLRYLDGKTEDDSEVIKSLVDQLDKLRRRLVYASRLDSLKAEYAKVLEQHDALQEEHGRLQTQEQQTSEALEELKAKYQKAKKERKKLAEERNDLQKDVSTYVASLQEMLTKRQAQEERLILLKAAEKAAKDQAEKEVQNIKEQLDTALRERQQYFKKYHALKQELETSPPPKGADESLEIVPPTNKRPRESAADEKKVLRRKLSRIASTSSTREVEEVLDEWDPNQDLEPAWHLATPPSTARHKPPSASGRILDRSGSENKPSRASNADRFRVMYSR